MSFLLGETKKRFYVLKLVYITHLKAVLNGTVKGCTTQGLQKAISLSPFPLPLSFPLFVDVIGESPSLPLPPSILSSPLLLPITSPPHRGAGSFVL